MSAATDQRAVPSAADRVLDALGSPVRRQILRRLAAGPLPVAGIAAGLPVSRPAVSRHLRQLSAAGLVTHDTSGTRHLYRLDRAGFAAAADWLDGFWDEALTRFRLVAENLGTGP